MIETLLGKLPPPEHLALLQVLADDGYCFVVAFCLGFYQQAVDGGPDPAIGLGIVIAEAFDGTIWQGAFFDVGSEGGYFRVDSICGVDLAYSSFRLISLR